MWQSLAFISKTFKVFELLRVFKKSEKFYKQIIPFLTLCQILTLNENLPKLTEYIFEMLIRGSHIFVVHYNGLKTSKIN